MEKIKTSKYKSLTDGQTYSDSAMLVDGPIAHHMLWEQCKVIIQPSLDSVNQPSPVKSRFCK